jgi:hypothetical protein
MKEVLAVVAASILLAGIVTMFPPQQASAQSQEWNAITFDYLGTCCARGVEAVDVYNDHLTVAKLREVNNPYVGVEHSANAEADKVLRLGYNYDNAAQFTYTFSPKHEQVQKIYFEGTPECSAPMWSAGLYQCFKIAGRLSFFDYGWGAGGTSAPKVKTGVRVWGSDWNIADGYQTFKPRFIVNFDTYSNSQDIKNKDTSDCSGWIQQSAEDQWTDHGCSGAVFRVYDSGFSEGFAFDPLTSYVELFLLDDPNEDYPITMYQEFSYENGEPIDSQDVRVITVSEAGGSSSECYYNVNPITVSYPCNIEDAWMLFGY